MRENIAIDASNSDQACKLNFVRAVETLAGARTITVAEVEQYNALAFDPDGAGRTITLPAEAQCAGCFLLITNEADAAPEVLTIQDDTPATICTPDQNECAILFCNGTNWFGLSGVTS